jgi:feruloyl-CoA synthase
MRGGLRWIRPEVELTTRPDGSLILQNKTPLAQYPANLCLWLRQNAQKFPDKKFLLQRGPAGDWQGLTYAQVLRRVNRLSNGLLALGLDGSRPVAVLSENRIELALVQLAAMQIGIPVAPISYAYSVRSQTGRHIKHILEVTAAPILVMSDAEVHMSKLSQWDTAQLRLFAFSNSEIQPNLASFNDLEDAGDTLSAEGEARFESVTAGTLAKIQFTSGSTNLPKGVEVSHGMMVSNQVGIAQMWPFLDSEEVVVDWLPWNHTFGGNFVFNMVLMRGGTFYIDQGSPTPQGLETIIQNIVDVSPTMYFGVPRSYTALYARMKTDERLKEAFFRNLKFIFTAAAALDQATYQGLRAMSAEVRAKPVPFFSAWGCTETAPDATLVYWEIADARVIGLPIPGVRIKVAPDPSGKRELRVKGPNVTRGYYNDLQATAAAFDEEGYYRSGDAGAFLDPDRPAAGLIFDGRTGEDFKLTTGTWVHNVRLRNSINQLGQPFLLEVVVAAPDADYLTALVFPNVPALRAHLPQASRQWPDEAAFLESEDVRSLFSQVFRQHNAAHPASSECVLRFALLTEPPRIDQNETTDKGYINQSAVLNHRAEAVARLYQDPPPEGVVVLED